VIGLSITGGDLIRAVKQANEFGLPASGQRLVPLIAMINEVHAIGPEQAQGARLVTPFYWDRDDKSRAFAKRFTEKRGGAYPNEIQAGVYSSVIEYLRAVKIVGSAADGKRIVDEMKRTELDDPLFGKVKIAANGRALNDVMLVEVKKPSEVKHPWEYFKIVATLPGSQVYRPAKDSGCNLVAGASVPR
jgi:branched-chain amino acid transport system substrate-binding protein